MKYLVIASGGMDSTVLFYYLKNKNTVVKVGHFRYGSNHQEQETKAFYNLFKKEDIVFDIELPFGDIKSALLGGAENIPVGEYTKEKMSQTVVPFRNGIFLSYAAAIAGSLNFDVIAIASHAGDHFIYPDCRVVFINAIRDAIQVGTGEKVDLIAPFQFFTKFVILNIAFNLGVIKEMFKSYSCYKGGEVHCGICSTCLERRSAFREAEIIDETKYKEDLEE